MTQDVSLFDKIRQSGQWWLNPWWLRGDSKYTKSQINAAFQKLKDIFDGAWFKSQFGRSDIHPLFGDFLGGFPFVLDDLVKFGLDLKEIEKCNINKVIEDLKKLTEYLSTRSVIEASAEVKRKGFDILFEPPVEGRTADFCAKNKNGKVYFEIKTLHTSGYELVESELMGKICQNLPKESQDSSFQAELEPCPNFWNTIDVGSVNPFRELPPNIITIIDTTAKNIAQSVTKIVNLRKVPCKKEIEKVMVTIKRGKDKTSWEISKSMRSLESEFKRAMRNLVNRDAIKQLPSCNPSIIGIKLFSLASSFRGNRDLAIDFFQKEFSKNRSKYVHIVGIILILSAYPVQYERRVIVNPYTKFRSISENYAILLEEE